MDLKHLTPELIGKVTDFANKSIDCIVTSKKKEDADASAAASMLELMRDFVSTKAEAATILNTYQYGLKECREAGAKAYDDGLYVVTKRDGRPSTPSADRKAASQAGAGRMSSYAKHLALLSWAITNDYALATDSVADAKSGLSTMTERARLLKDAFDRALMVSCKTKVKMVSLDGVEWDLEFVEGLKDEQKAMIGFTDSSDTINRELGSTYKRLQHQMAIARLRNSHNNLTLQRWRQELGLPDISGNA